MKARITSRGTAGRARLTVVSCAALMVVVSAGVTACTGSPSSSVPAIFSPSTSASGRTATTPAQTPSTSPVPSATTTSPTATATTTTPVTFSPTPTSPPPTTYYPTGAPQTGGGGTAGLQDGLVFVFGSAAVLAGLGGLAYRRRFNRRR